MTLTWVFFFFFRNFQSSSIELGDAESLSSVIVDLGALGNFYGCPIGDMRLIGFFDLSPREDLREDVCFF